MLQRVLKIAALVCFILAALLELGVASVEHSSVLIPMGLALWVGSEV